MDVAARALPAQEHALVRALQEHGEVVAATGDGVNDIPALQAADVGLCMGERGTRGAREASSIVLLDDDFGTLVRAIAEGRQLFDNLQRCLQYLLRVHIPLVFTAALLPLAGYPLLGVSVLLIQVRPFAAVLGLNPLHVDDWARVALGGLVALLIGRGLGPVSGRRAPWPAPLRRHTAG
ncbi:HAD-IC family P-type ATPase [Myxococcus faecalis]|uniref:HAD-IC family P-type ATPase n=1 Tax=Myxococcus faecalis TaxID=3115646 RepID=UPI003CE882B7